MSTIIFNIVIIIAIILVAAYIVFLLGCLLFPSKKGDNKEKEEDYKEDIKNLERRQKAIYNRLLELDKKKEEKEAIKTEPKEEIIPEPENVEEEQVVEEVKEEPEEEKVEEKVEETVEEALEEVKEEVVEESEEEDAEEAVSVENERVENKKKLPTRRRSFALKLSSSTEATKRYFSQITNRLRLYGLTARIGKSKVMFRLNKEVYARMIFKGKRIILCLPLNPKSEKFDPAVYKQLDYSDKKGFEDIAFAIKVTNKKSVELIFGLIDEVAKKFDFIENPKFKEIDYVEKYPDIYTDFEKKGYGYLLKTEVLKQDVEVYDDAFADKIIIEQKSEDKEPKRFIKAEVSIQEFNNRYTDTSIPVDLERLKASDLIAKNANYLIVKASSRIDQPFTVCAHEFEPDAVKMICMAGGKAVKIEFSPNEEGK